MGYARSSPIVRQLRIDCGASVYRWVGPSYLHGYVQTLKSMQNRKQTDFGQTGLLNLLTVFAEMVIESGCSD